MIGYGSGLPDERQRFNFAESRAYAMPMSTVGRKRNDGSERLSEVSGHSLAAFGAPATSLRLACAQGPLTRPHRRVGADLSCLTWLSLF